MTKTQFDQIKVYSETVQYTSLMYSDFEALKDASVLCHTDELCVMLNTSGVQPVIEYATDSFEVLTAFLNANDYKGAIHFVPQSGVNDLKRAGFKILGEYADFFTTDFNTSSYGKALNYAKKENAADLEEISQACLGLSRGFFGEKKAWFEEWIEENAILLLYEAEDLIGFCCVAIYNEGTTLWIREVCVMPTAQGRGHGHTLMKMAMTYGHQNKVSKGFLAVDVENHNAIKLYSHYGFKRKEDLTEIQMIR